jgi:flagellar basal-body rod protein FlgG
MNSGIHAAAAGMNAHQAWLDMLSNDIANVNTTGYHAQRVDFRELAYGESGGAPVGAGSAAVTVGASQTQGTLLPNDSPLALAITGEGYFQVRRADGSVGLTRSGDFHLDAQGSIVTAAGERLEPPITVPAGTSPSSISVAPDGTVMAAGKEIGKIAVVNVPAPNALLAVAGGQFAPTEASGAPTATTGSAIVQGALEGSGVDLAEAMVGVVQAQRGFEFSSRALRTQDQLMEITNNIRR